METRSWKKSILPSSLDLEASLPEIPLALSILSAFWRGYTAQSECDRDEDGYRLQSSKCHFHGPNFPVHRRRHEFPGQPAPQTLGSSSRHSWTALPIRHAASPYSSWRFGCPSCTAPLQSSRGCGRRRLWPACERFISWHGEGGKHTFDWLDIVRT